MIYDFCQPNENKEVFDGVIKSVSISTCGFDFYGFNHGESKITLNFDGTGELIHFHERRFITANEEKLGNEILKLLTEDGVANVSDEAKEIYKFRYFDVFLLEKISDYFSKPFKKTDSVIIDGGGYQVCITNTEGKSFCYGDTEAFSDKGWEELYNSIWEIANKVDECKYYPSASKVSR